MDGDYTRLDLGTFKVSYRDQIAGVPVGAHIPGDHLKLRGMVMRVECRTGVHILLATDCAYQEGWTAISFDPEVSAAELQWTEQYQADPDA